MAISGLLTLVNGVYSSVSGGITTFITLNYFLGQGIVSLISWLLKHLYSFLLSCGVALNLMLEDLGTFIIETCETIWSGFMLVTCAIDSVLGGISFIYTSVKTAALSFVSNVVRSCEAVQAGVSVALQSITGFCHLLGASLVLLAGIVPRTVYLIYAGMKAYVTRTCFMISKGVLDSYNYVLSAPLESLIGFVASLAIAFATYKLGQRSIRVHNLTWGWLAQLAFKIVCFLYLQICLALFGLGRGIARSVEFTFAHLHVPRFHHAGDLSDDDDDDNQVNNVAVNDNSDFEDDGNNIRRRNYDLLLKKRAEKRKNVNGKVKGQGCSKDNKHSPDMEELLFEQVEREREDKLCVVCQDREKCIMILPCRHLCICQDCQAPLLKSRNGVPICPICRKLIRQTIKVYL